MKLTAAVMMLGLLATSRCPGEPVSVDVPKDPNDPNVDCWGLRSDAACAPGVQPIDPQEQLGFNKSYYGRSPQTAVVDSVSGTSMVLEGPWDMPYTFTWFDELADSFEVGDEVQLSGGDGWAGGGWAVVASSRATVAHLVAEGFSEPSPSRPTEDGPQVDFVPACRSDGDRIVYSIALSLGDEAVEIGQGERGRIGEWEVLFHGAASAPGSMEDCMVGEGYFRGVVSAWKRP